MLELKLKPQLDTQSRHFMLQTPHLRKHDFYPELFLLFLFCTLRYNRESDLCELAVRGIKYWAGCREEELYCFTPLKHSEEEMIVIFATFLEAVETRVVQPCFRGGME